jgi:hypothetical protein
MALPYPGSAAPSTTYSTPASANALHMSAEAAMNVVFMSLMLRRLRLDVQKAGRPNAAKAIRL